ncbi:MAG: hypothetical protein KGL44_00365 [Sphingomonadales bacterium]|nr:hypothetical protein [Sphingomonadales bacterium]
MKALRIIALIFGILLLLSGLLWTGQGLGIIMWPSSSFMLADRQWAVNGAITALLGAGLVWWSRRRRG